ncbi:Beta-galactosidase 17 [Acorus calamus]|uniref:Beta-galactosidase n=1 Tax=Acorus calamus TaxID=4465 RepID=A0AAV9CN22_ACOCL|nr:Beta-galactosidase 17 [Acorus calamus]
MNQKPTRKGGRRKNHWVMMACKGSRRGKLLFAVLLTLSIWAFFPTIAPLPALSSSSPPSFSSSSSEVTNHGFRISDDMFWKDNQPFQIIGGDLHYFRVLPQYWEDRLLRAKALGLNTIQTYVPWNLHEPHPGKLVFEGIADIELFLKQAQKLGFLVMLRVGPYICAEWDFGGFPAWLLSIEPALKLRSSDPSFLHLVESWWNVLLPKIHPLLYKNGGPIIMVQIENEFGSYGDDKIYLHRLVRIARRHLGSDVILYTTDGGSKDTLDRGTIPGEDVYSAVDFSTGEDPWPIFELQKKYNPPGKSPPLSAEFYTGWLTHWGERIAETSARSTAAALQKILSLNGSAVLYMAHGGTNFGYFSGANTGANSSIYQPDLTSYDYDAPIKESGDVDNPKFRELRSVIQKYSHVSLPPFPPITERRQYGRLKMKKVSSLFEIYSHLSGHVEVVESQQPLSMEAVGQLSGFLLYQSQYEANKYASSLSIPKVHDRAQVFVSCSLDDIKKNWTYVGVIERWSNEVLIVPSVKCASNINLFILVENLGHVNYGPYIYDKKGILSDVILDGSILYQWKMYPISLDNLNKNLEVNPIMQVAESQNAEISFHEDFSSHSKRTSNVPVFYEGRFNISTANKVKDTYISFRGWTKGFAFVNNFNIGRFWPVMGPQCNLYVPAPILQHGENSLVVLELHAPNPELVVDLVGKPDFTCGSKAH